jgi:putative serine protease PepD
VGFAVPIDIAKAVADRIVSGQSVNSGYMGVSSADVTGATTGAELMQVESGSPAAVAGLEVGDVVVAFDGAQVSSAIDLVAAVTPREPGETVVLTVVRDDQSSEVELTLGESPS